MWSKQIFIRIQEV